MRMTTENILKIRDKMRKKRGTQQHQPEAGGGKKIKRRSREILIFYLNWGGDNVRVGNEPGCPAMKQPPLVYVLQGKKEFRCQRRKSELYGKQVDEIKIRPYEHHAKYYETDQMGIIHHSNISNGWKRRAWI